MPLLGMTTLHDRTARTAKLFRNQRNLAVRIPTDWISPDADVSEVELSFDGDVITVRPVLEHRLGQVLEQLKQKLDSDPVLRAELDSWEDPVGPPPALTRRAVPPA